MFNEIFNNLVKLNQIFDKNKKVVIFGAGSGGKATFFVFKTLSINPVCFVDNNPSMVGSKIFDIPIEAPSCLLNESKESLIILIASVYYEEISDQLSDMGFKESIHYFLVLYTNKRNYIRKDPLDPIPYGKEWPSLRSTTGRVDIHSLVASFIKVSKIIGPYLEFGVGMGRSAVAAIRANQFYNEELVKEFFLFDSFVGLPDLEGLDEGSNQFNKGDYCYSKEEVINFLTDHNVYSEDKVHLISGYFKDSLPSFKLTDYGYSSASIIHIDVDLFSSSCREVLNLITSYVKTGTVILFDDWNCFNASNQKGERAAVIEWLNENPNIKLNDFADYGWNGKVFIVDIYNI